MRVTQERQQLPAIFRELLAMGSDQYCGGEGRERLLRRRPFGSWIRCGGRWTGSR
jgi:hypothetical protein